MIPVSKSKSNRANIYPWQIARLLPNLQRQIVARFHRRNDAIEYMRVLQRLQPDAEFELVYEVAVPAKESGELL